MRVRSRRHARERALRILFEVDVGRQPPADALAQVQKTVPPTEWAFIRKLCEGTWAAQKELDARLGALTGDWAIDRLANTDRAVLRMAAYELLHMDTPPRVVINEAVELAKAYGTEESGKFVNGVLGALHRSRVAAGPVHGD